ncbi:glycoside hydrolase family protein [Carboxylicivirga sediminis]|uniref:Glycoside hydrolase family protein n=1 Tax=Carboxylicivirga sediminis TaxID=2006564 RepID=A0A941F363_9BACT|nr:glycoside hydrolase family protein [Carboxylicivirga sediminis]MBR8535886.1 glycoside hydrolase family protein [Carboxylicivirga sediminis]
MKLKNKTDIESIMTLRRNWWIPVILFSLIASVDAQIIERERPAEWKSLVKGGRFMDRFLPIPTNGELTADTWGAGDVVPRYVDNGLEEDEYSYWGGNAIKDNMGVYHLFVCRWPESAEKGHMAWPDSEVVHAIGTNSLGPYTVQQIIGKGHNPELYKLNDGRYVIYVIRGYYISDSLNGPWEYKQFQFDRRDRNVHDGLSNLTFAKREDGSYLMVCRGGGVWISQTGLSPWNQVTQKSAYPSVEGRFEDPVIWKTNVQYHMIVNDWYGRIAYYLRSKDGIKWKVEPGEAYMPGITTYTDGVKENWFKYERIKMLQDEYGRATQAHFAVIDTIKWNDLANDNHSSKHICIPLTVGRLMTVLDNSKIHAQTKTIKVKIMAEEGFNPHTDIKLESLRLGASEKVNFGGGCKVIDSRIDGNDLILVFDAQGNGVTDDNFVIKLVGEMSKGQLLFAYARLPWVDYLEPALSARLPKVQNDNNQMSLSIEVQNFGQQSSCEAKLSVFEDTKNGIVELVSGSIKQIEPYEKILMNLPLDKKLEKGMRHLIVRITEHERTIEEITGEVFVNE